jgi:hypothetical protein
MMINLEKNKDMGFEDNQSFLHGIDHISNGVSKLEVEQSNFAALDIEKMYQQH